MSYDPSGGLTGWDLTGFHEGHDTECWRRLGAHEATVQDSERGTIFGTRFSVWAPNAQAVRLVGDFNYWNGEGHYMQLVPGSGVWSLFVEGASTGNLYKFEVLGVDGVWRLKADPMARFAEAAPHTASIVYESQYDWGDDDWMWYRGQKKQHAEPMSIYEVHIGSWRKGLTYLELADELVEYVSWQGYTHVEFMPVAQHPFEGSWGYHVTGYYAPMSKFGSPDEFRHLVDKLHQAGIGVHRGLGARALRDRPLGAAALRRNRAVRARGSAEGLAPGLGLLHLQLRPQRGEELPDLATPTTGWTSSTSTGCGSTASPRCSIWTTPARRGSGSRTSTVATRTWRRSSCCSRPIPTLTDASPAHHGRRGVHVMAGRHAGHRVRGSRLRIQVEHGLDERLAALHGPRADLPAVPPPRDDVRHGVRLLGELHPADQPRRGRARQGLDVRAGARRTSGASSPPCAPSTRSCGASRARSCCSWGPSSPSVASSARVAASTGGRARNGDTTACSG